MNSYKEGLKSSDVKSAVADFFDQRDPITVVPMEIVGRPEGKYEEK